MDKQKVLCVGSMGRDVFFPTSAGAVSEVLDKRLWCFGYGEKIHVSDRYQAPGGCACNVSVGFARLGIDATAYGVVGDDSDGIWIKDNLISNGVDIEHVKILKEYNSDISFIIVRENEGDRVIFANRDVGESLELDKRDVKWYDWVFVGSLYGDKRLHNMKVLHDLAVNKKISLMVNPGMSNIKNDIDSVLSMIHHSKILFVNKFEGKQILKKSGKDLSVVDSRDEVKIMKFLHDLMMFEDSIVVLTFGKKGAWCYNGKEVYHTKTVEKTVLDTTGAGDAFASGFASAVISGLDLIDAMKWGATNSNSVIDSYGAQKGLLLNSEMKDKFDEFSVEKVL